MTRPTYPFDVRSRDVWRIAVPASLAFITEPMVGIVDITVIGRLGDAALLGGLALGALAFDFIFSLAYFLRLGTAGLTAQAVGSRDPNDGLLHAVRALLLAAGIGLVMIALSVPLFGIAELIWAPSAEVASPFATYFYIRIWTAPFSLINYVMLGWFYGRAEARTGMSLQFVIHGINIVASIVLVFGLGWGVAGAAFGTVLGSATAAIIGLILFFRHFGGFKRTLSLIVPEELRHTTALKRMFALSRDLMIRSAALMSAYAIFAAVGSRTGDDVLAANAVLLNLMMISSFFLDGLAQASEQLCGKAVGANWRPAFERASRLALACGIVLSAALGALLYFAGPAIISLMTTSAPVRDEAMQFLWLAALTAFSGMPAFVYDGILTGATLNVDMRNGMLVSLAVFIAAALALAPFGNLGLWAALHIWLLSRGAIYWWALERRKPALFVA
jgi:MATE family multidrug resistance protein